MFVTVLRRPTSRRSVLQLAWTGATGILAWDALGTPGASASREPVLAELRDLERQHRTRLGVFARNLDTGQVVDYRAHERFPILSVFKTLSAAQVLRDYDHAGEFLDRLVRYTEADLVEHSPVTAEQVHTGMSVRGLCAAAIQYSDNTAGNLLLRETAGPSGVTRFCRDIGDSRTRLDRWETDLNTAYPGDVRDTTTPHAIGNSYAALMLGAELDAGDQHQLTAWLRGNTTTAEQFGAGVPDDWVLADKTGGGDFGTRNDVGVTWTAAGTPLVLSVLSATTRSDAEVGNELIADTARALVRTLAPDE